MVRKKILWLASWYPNRIDPFDGDFIQRHAAAAALYNDIHVIHVAADEKQTVTDDVEQQIFKKSGLTEQIIYHKKLSTLLGRVKGFLKWRRLFKTAIEKYVQETGKPDFVHVHIPIKAGLLAIWMKRKYRISFAVTEHLGIYNNVDQRKFRSRNFIFRYYTKKVFSAATVFTSVSKFLAEGVNGLVLKKDYIIIPNVVNTTFFNYEDKHHPVFRFIHVSNMVPLKNVKGILDAARLVHDTNRAFELVLVGNRGNLEENYAKQLGIQDITFFVGEVPYERVAKEMKDANVLILFSNIENSPCVICEALCTGRPVIATDVGGVPELVNVTNGMLIKPYDVKNLAQAMTSIMRHYHLYDRRKIAENAKRKFDYEVVGKMFDNIYKKKSV